MSDQGTFSNGCSSQCPAPQIRLYQTVIFVTPVLFTLVLLLLFCMLYLRRRRTARVDSQFRTQFFTRGLFSAPLEQGLSKSFRQGLPIIPVDENFAATREDTQCAVCLGDYQLNEKLHQLPVCGHAFHVECIDEWLADNTTCPICRTSLLQDGKVVPLDSPAPQNTSSGDSSRGVESLRWEERVIAENQDAGLISRGEVANGESSHAGAPSTGPAVRMSIEHVINVERS